MLDNESHGELFVIKKVLVSVAVLLGAAGAAATPASADPNPFGTLGCSCHPAVGVPGGKPGVQGQVDQGIQNGLGSLHRKRG
jgi:hypothetical protein